MTSQETPDEVPNLDIIIGCDQSPVNASEYNITLFHNGGDTISASEFEIQAYNAAGKRYTCDPAQDLPTTSGRLAILPPSLPTTNPLPS
jgi:hypothetical protein